MTKVKKQLTTAIKTKIYSAEPCLKKLPYKYVHISWYFKILVLEALVHMLQAYGMIMQRNVDQQERTGILLLVSELMAKCGHVIVESYTKVIRAASRIQCTALAM